MNRLAIIPVILVLLVCASLPAFSQDVGNTASISQATAHKEMSAAKQNLLSRLNEARLANDVAAKTAIEAELNRMDGNVTVQLQQDNGIQFEMATPGVNPPSPEIAGVTTIDGGGFWAIATATVPTTGRIWACGTKSGGSGTDTVKTYYSDNQGQTWHSWAWWRYIAVTHFRAHELDIEVVNDGTNIWLFGVVGVTNPSTYKPYCDFFRWNVTTGGSWLVTKLTWPYADSAANIFYNPRITSDNSKWTSATYLYVIASKDSQLTPTNHHLNQVFATLQAPFVTSPTITYKAANPGTGGFWWHTPGADAGTYLDGDIAYLDSGNTDHIMTVYNFLGSNNLYLAWSRDVGATNDGALPLSQTDPTKGARLAFNGGSNNLNGMLVYLKYYGGLDWDVYYQNTTTGGFTTGSWTSSNYIDYSGNIARTCDLVAVRGANNLFKAAYAQGDSAMYAGFNGSAWNSPPRMHVNTPKVDTTFGAIRAGYAIGGASDCFAVWSAGNGSNLYASWDFWTPVSVGDERNIPRVYVLEQNYPNPFNPTTEIRYQLPGASLVTLVVYDILGRTVATLVNELQQPGEHRVKFEGNSIASGPYTYRIIAGDFVQTKKMLLIK